MTNAEKMTCDLETPYILIHEKAVEPSAHAAGFEAVVQSGRPLLIIAEDIEGEALATLVVNNPWWSEGRGRKGAWFGDRRKATGRYCDLTLPSYQRGFGTELENVSRYDGSARVAPPRKRRRSLKKGRKRSNSRCNQIRRRLTRPALTMT